MTVLGQYSPSVFEKASHQVVSLGYRLVLVVEKLLTRKNQR